MAIKREVKQQKDRMAYRRNTQKKKDSVHQYYRDNLQMERDRKRVGSKQIYDRNPEKERDRKRVESKQIYDRNPEKERDRKREKAKDTAGEIQKFLDEGRYGPIFRD